MQSPHADSLPFRLSLHDEVLVAAGEAGALNFWIENLGEHAITAYCITLAAGPWAEAPRPASAPFAHVGTGEAVCCPVPFKPETEGLHAVSVRIDLTAGGQRIEAMVPTPISLDVVRRRSDGKLTVEVGAAHMNRLKSGGGDIDIVGREGAITGVQSDGGDVHIELQAGGFVENIDTSARRPRGMVRVHVKPPDDQLQPLPLRQTPSGWGAPGEVDLVKFAAGWRQLGRPLLEEFSFIDQQERPWQSARVGDHMLFRLRSAPGHVTLLHQGSSGALYQFVPHGHHGVQQIQAGGVLYLPSRPPAGDPVDRSTAMVFNFGDAARNVKADIDVWSTDIKFDSPGRELALAIVSPTPLAQPVLWAGRNDERPNAVSTEQLVQILSRAWAMPECKVGMATIQVEPK